MKTSCLFLVVVASVLTGVAVAQTDTVGELLHEYAAQGATEPDAQAGQRLWLKTFTGEGRFATRSCTSCHGDNLKQAGRHIRTNKLIEPMAPSINPQRLSQSQEVKKWFKRNCKWTLGRECTATEKANLLAFIKQQ